MKITSIRFRLIVGGIFLVLLPLLVTGYFSTTKSSAALSDLAKKEAASIASDLAALTDQVLKEEMKLAEALAADRAVADLLTLVGKGGAAAAAGEIADMRGKLEMVFSRMGSGYQGIFLGDAKGDIFTGILDNGQEYKGINIADQNYFNSVKTGGRTMVGEIVRSRATDRLIAVVCVPVRTEGDGFVGVFGIVLKIESLTELISGRKLGETGYGFMTDKKGIILAHPDAKNILNLDITRLEGMERIAERMLAGEKGVAEYTYKGTDKIAGFAPLAAAPWFIAATQDQAEFMKAANAIRNASLIITLAAMALTGAAVAYFAGLIIKPINRATQNLKDIAQGEGDLTLRLDAGTKDEMGELAFWFNSFVEKLQGIISLLAENSGKVDSAAGDLSTIAGDLARGAADTSRRAANVATASEEMSANLNNVAAAMEQSATNTNMVASAAEEMSSTINEISENAEKARNISSKAVDQAKNAAEKMGELGSAAQRIGMVTETITEISEQTNLLALNATIEAARAGEAGKGFAVVANEIKDLAKQTAAATLNIRQQIEEVQRTTSSTVAEIDQISEVIGGVNEIVTTIAAAVEEQTAATREIADNISQASQGIQEVNENVSQSSHVAGTITEDIAKVNFAATGISESSSKVQDSAEGLRQMASELNRIVGSFKI